MLDYREQQQLQQLTVIGPCALATSQVCFVVMELVGWLVGVFVCLSLHASPFLLSFLSMPPCACSFISSHLWSLMPVPPLEVIVLTTASTYSGLRCTLGASTDCGSFQDREISNHKTNNTKLMIVAVGVVLRQKRNRRGTPGQSGLAVPPSSIDSPRQVRSGPSMGETHQIVPLSGPTGRRKSFSSCLLLFSLLFFSYFLFSSLLHSTSNTYFFYYPPLLFSQRLDKGARSIQTHIKTRTFKTPFGSIPKDLAPPLYSLPSFFPNPHSPP